MVSWLETYHVTLSWSHSRSRLFEECTRKYYWRYYAPYGGNTPQETIDRALVYLLGRLTTIPFLVGTIVHDLAREGLRAARDGHLWTPGTYAARARTSLTRALRASEKAAAQPSPRPGRGTVILDVHYYLQPFGPEEERTARERVEYYAQKLYQHPTFQSALENAQNLLAVERFYRFSVLDVPVYAVPDLVQRLDDGRLRLVDWKTGSGVRQQMEAYTDQLSVYALYAQRKWVVSARQIACEVAELHTGTTIGVPVSDEDLKRAEGRIAASIVAMQSRLRDLARNQAHRDDFPMLASPDAPRSQIPSLCLGCTYRLACYGARVRDWP